MKPEAKFKSWLVKKIRELSYMVQTIETTTGRGVPDLVVLRPTPSGHNVLWIEVKVQNGSCVIRPEQYIWHMKAWMQGVEVVTVCQHPVTKQITAYRVKHAVKLASGWKLTSVIWSHPAKEFKGHSNVWLD